MGYTPKADFRLLSVVRCQKIKMKSKLKYDTPIRTICASLFCIFSFIYIYIYQGESLALIQDLLSQGKTSNNAFVTALVITLLLQGLQYLINRGGKLHGRFEALSYLPSCVLLALVAKFDNALAYSPVQWIVALLITTVMYILAVWVNRNTLQLREARLVPQLSFNLGVLVALFVSTGWYGSNTTTALMELAAWKYTHSGKYEKVLKVGKYSSECNADLTALRNLALAKTGQLGDKLFSYPQPYGSDGLLMNRYNVQTPTYGAGAYYDCLGAHPYGGESAAAFYKRVLLKSDSEEYRNLYVAALLLDKDLEALMDFTVNEEQSMDLLSDMPTHYQEAWMIYNEQNPFNPIAFTPDSAVIQRYHEYVTSREQYVSEPSVMKELCKRDFGNTYWYYYDFVGT